MPPRRNTNMKPYTLFQHIQAATYNLKLYVSIYKETAVDSHKLTLRSSRRSTTTKPETLNETSTKPQTLQKPETRSETLNLQRNLNPSTYTLNPRPSTWHPEPCTAMMMM